MSEVVRERLIDQIDQAGSGSIVVIVAGPGYGKSTLVRQWAVSSRFAPVVVELSRVHNDLQRFGLDLVAAIERSGHAVGSLAERAARPDADWLRDLLPELLDVLEEQKVSLVLDDVHAIVHPQGVDFLAALSGRWGATGVLVLCGRVRPKTALIRRSPSAGTLVLGEADLEFDDDELSQVHQKGATEEQAAELLAQTGAWPAGVRLVALTRAEPLVSNGSADPHTSVDDYLLKQVLADFSRDDLEFFAYVALMSPASVALLNEVLGRNDTFEILRDFQRRGTPMIRLPASADGLVRVHALMGDVAVQELRRTMPGNAESMLIHASDVARRTGAFDEAFELLNRSGDREAMKTLAYQMMGYFVLNGKSAMLAAWLEHFTELEVRSDPRLACAAVVTMRPRRLQTVDELLDPFIGDESVMPDGITAAEAARRTRISCGLAPGDAVVSDVTSGWKHTSAGRATWDQYAKGRFNEAVELLHGLERHAERYAITDGVRLAKLSIISLELGQLEDSQQWIRAARQRFESAGTPDIAQAFLCDIADLMIARRVGDHESLRPLAQAALAKLAAIGDGTQLERVTALIEIADTYLDLAVGVDVVRSLLNEARDVLHTWPGSAPLLHERLTLAKTRLSKVSARVAEVSELTTAEIRVLQYLPSHFTMTRIAQELYISQSTVKTHCQAIYRKLRADNRAEAVATAIQSGLLPGHVSLSPTR